MTTPIMLPDLGIAPAMVSVWYFDVGESVLAGERVVEVIVDGAAVEIVAPATGRLAQKHLYQGDAVLAWQALGAIDDSDASARRS